MPKRVTAASFVGRDDELRRLDDAVDAAVEGRGSQLVLVGGDAGIGKTRLIEELCRRQRQAGGLVATGGCVDAGGAGYAPLAEALRDLRYQLGDDRFAVLVDAAAPDLRPLVAGRGDGQEITQAAVLAQTMELLVRLGQEHPGAVIVLEDLHWADASTLDLVGFLVRNLRNAPVVLVLSYRADDVHRRHPLRPLLTELTRNAAVDHFVLGGMSRSEVTVLLAAVSGTVPLDGVVDDVFARSEGNPFYAEELFVAGTWGRGLPGTLHDAILGRIARLPDPTPAVLREAALLGEHIDERLLAAVTGRPVDEVADALHQAVADRVLVVEGGGCRFRHALVREAAYDDLLPGERQRLHGAAAAALADETADFAPVADHVLWALLAHHWAAADDHASALRASVRAAEACERVGALAAASAQYQRAVALWSRVGDPEAAAGVSRPVLLGRAADAAYHTGAPGEAVRLLEAALELLDPACEPEERALLLQRLGDHRWAACDQAGSGRARADAVALLAGRPPTPALAHALAAHGAHLMLTDQVVEAEAALQLALEVSDRTGTTLARARALTAFGHVLTKLGRLDDGVDACREALLIAEREGSADDLGRAHVMLTATLLAATRYEDVVTLAGAGLDHARRAGMLASDGVLLAYNRAEALCRLGRWDEAEEALIDAASDPFGPHGTTGAVVASRIALWRGRLDDAAHHRDRALTTVDASGLQTPEALALAARIAADEGRFDDARRDGAAAVEGAERSQDPSLVAAVGAVVIGIEADRAEAAIVGSRSTADAATARATSEAVLDRLRRHVDAGRARGVRPAPDADASLATALAEHARAQGRPDVGLWEAAAAAWDALRCPYWAAVARYRAADAVLRSRGNRLQATALAAAALRTADDLGAAPLADAVRRLAERGRLDLTTDADRGVGVEPAPPDPLDDLGVSPREREVLALLARGRTNRQIADELFISDKTASVHVTHLLRKLGVPTRIDAAAVAQRLGLGA